MKYEKARNLVFDYFIKEEEFNKINVDIRKFERNMPYDNGPASIYTMGLMDVEIEKKKLVEDEMKILKEEIELLLRVFK